MGAFIKYAGNPAVILSIVVAVLFGLYKWEGYKAARAKAEVEGVHKSAGNGGARTPQRRFDQPWGFARR